MLKFLFFLIFFFLQFFSLKLNRLRRIWNYNKNGLDWDGKVINKNKLRKIYYKLV